MSKEITIINLNREYTSLLKENFKKRLQTKTSWGRIEVLQEFLESVADAAEETLLKATTEKNPF